MKTRRRKAIRSRRKPNATKNRMRGTMHRAEICRLRNDERLTWCEIAQRVGLAVSTCHEHYQRAYAAADVSIDIDASECKTRDLVELDAIQESRRGRALDQNDDKAAGVVIRCILARAKLLGYDGEQPPDTRSFDRLVAFHLERLRAENGNQTSLH